MAPIPIMVDTTGILWASANLRSSPSASLSNTPPPAQIRGRFAFSSSLTTFLI